MWSAVCEGCLCTCRLALLHVYDLKWLVVKHWTITRTGGLHSCHGHCLYCQTFPDRHREITYYIHVDVSIIGLETWWSQVRVPSRPRQL